MKPDGMIATKTGPWHYRYTVPPDLGFEVYLYECGQWEPTARRRAWAWSLADTHEAGYPTRHEAAEAALRYARERLELAQDDLP